MHPSYNLISPAVQAFRVLKPGGYLAYSVWPASHPDPDPEPNPGPGPDRDPGPDPDPDSFLPL